MIVTTEEMPNGLGRLTIRCETDEERLDFERACPKILQPGILHGYEWKAGPAGSGMMHLVLFAVPDPDYKPPQQAKPEHTYTPAPKAIVLADWKMADLVTKAAELSVKHLVGETKAALIAKIIPAWEAANQAIAARAQQKADGNPATPVTPPPTPPPPVDPPA